jgi:radical SAM superfamily enzyme YgiQ (UPF0313 family)
LVQSLKINLLSRGIQIDAPARSELTRGGTEPFAIREYATTGGVTLVFDEDAYVNAPYDEAFCRDAEAVLTYDAGSTEPFVVRFRGEAVPAAVLPLPGYLRTEDSRGRAVVDTAYSHADRVRISPIAGCTFSCKFCDTAGKRYIRHPVEQMLKAFEVAKADTALPVRHALISGGTPGPKDYDYFADVCQKLIGCAGIPVDMMMAPRHDTTFIECLAEWGIHGYAINLELYDDEAASRIVREKHGIGLKGFATSIERAVALTGGNGRVRSLMVVGLEPEEQTLRGVEFLARLGCDPVLSPFRPAQGTALAAHPPPSPELLERVYLAGLEIADKHGVKLGPRCIPCQHNSLTFPDASGAYYYS